MLDPSLIAEITVVRGDSITATINAGAAPGLTFSRGYAYYVGQVGAYVRIPLGLIDLFAVVVEVGSSPLPEASADPGASRPWMRLELLGEAHRDGTFRRGVARYPSIGDRVLVVTLTDLSRIYSADDSSHAVRLGSIANAPHLPALIDVNKLVSRHAAVVGNTGSGKSTTVAQIVRAITDPSRFASARVVVIDIHGEYMRAFANRATTFAVATAAPRSSANSSQLYLPYWALSFADFLDLSLGSIDGPSEVIVQGLVTELKRSYVRKHPEIGLAESSVTADTPVPFSIRNLWLTLHEMHFATHTAATLAQTDATKAYALDAAGKEMRGDAEKIQPPSYLAATAGGPNRIYQSGMPINIRRQTDSLGARLRDSRYDFLFRPGPWDVASNGEISQTLGQFLALWLGDPRPIVIANLSGVPDQIMQRVVSVLLRLIYDALVWSRNLSEGARERPVLIVLEEAHRYLNDSRDAAGEIVERIVKEGRKFGVGTLIVSQRPSEIRATVLSQLGSFVVLRLTNSADRALVRSTLPDNLAGLFDAVPLLRTGEAFVTGESVHLPTRVIIDAAPDQRPDSDDPLVMGTTTRGWGAPRLLEDFEDVASTWIRQTPESSRSYHPVPDQMRRIEMDREQVASEALRSVGYDEPTQTLEVEFKNGRVYQYFDVPASTHQELIGSGSVGSYFATSIRDQFRSAQL